MDSFLKSVVQDAAQSLHTALQPSNDQRRFGSSFDPTANNEVKWFIDGKDYFYALSEALEHAKTSIAIWGWWVTPELFLRRPPAQNKQWRLDRVLARAAERGVKVYGIVYQEVAEVLTLDSKHTVDHMNRINPPMIKFMRHPEHDILKTNVIGAIETAYWSHHDKAVVIDDSVVFWGGLDSCFGRWDYNAHPLTDLHADIRQEIWVGQDYNNARIMDFEDVGDWRANMLNRTESARMPWHDVSMSARGPIVHSFSAHFIERWNFVKRVKSLEYSKFPPLTPAPVDIVHDTVKPLADRFAQAFHLKQGSSATYGAGPPGIEAPSTGPTGVGGTYAQLCRSATEWSQGVPHEKSIQNAYISLIEHATHFVYIENQFFITAVGPESKPIENLIGKALVDRILRAARAGQNFKVIVTIPQVPGFAGDVTGKGAAGTRAIMDYQYRSICRGGSSIMETIKKAGFDPHQYISFYNLRSFDRIPYTQAIKDQQAKSGIDTVKADIAMGMDLNGLDTFDKGVAVTNLGKGDSLDHVRHTSTNSAQSSTKPAAPKKSGISDLFGWDDNTDDKSKQEQLNKTLSAFEGAGSKPTVNPSIAQQGMMTGANVSDEHWSGTDQEAVRNFVTEEVYIHTKLMIVDDRVVICGSANLNDRSQVGDRDSEIAVVIEDPATLPSVMNGTAWNVSPFAASLRRKLFREHLGLLHPATVAEQTPNNQPLPIKNEYDWGSKEDKLVEDPFSSAFWNVLTSHATRNTEIYRDIFHTVPDDNIRTYAEYDKFVTQTPIGHVADYNMPLSHIVDGLSQIRGHIVNMPLHFLEEENLIDILHVNELTDKVYL